MRLNIPNILSITRVLIAPAVLILIVSEDRTAIRTGCILFVLGAASDYLDGWYARKYKEATEWGNFFDPLADKILTTSAFIAFVFMNIIPFWIVLIIIIRDFGTTLLRIYAESAGSPIKTSKSAKFKTTIQMVFIAYILILMFLSSSGIIQIVGINVKSLIYSDFTYCLAIILMSLCIWSILEYFFQNKQVVLHLWFRVRDKIVF